MRRTVYVDNRNLVLDIDGEGDPPLVLVSCLGADGSEWAQVRDAMTTRTTVVTHARPGLGDSDPVTGEDADRTYTFTHACEQLHQLLEAAGVGTPRVLLGHSIGGLIVDRYATEHPGSTAGLIFVEATNPRLTAENLHLDWVSEAEGVDETGYRYDHATALTEFLENPPPKGPPSAVITAALGRWSRIEDPDLYAPMTLRQVDAAWQEHQCRLADRYDADLIRAFFAGHMMNSDTPALIAHVIDAIVEAARTNEKPRYDPETLFTAGGHLVES